ncbi:MAG: protein kinase [Deltaproteobacteria bacterium]|nr:protein kinase [Deltaproteobacteria bacterium]
MWLNGWDLSGRAQSRWLIVGDEGATFGNYVLEERLAVGGMAEVFRARRLGVAGFSRPVCIKRILRHLCDDPAFVEMFVDEASIGAQLRHSNIVAIEDFGEVSGQYYLAMELVQGVDVSRLIAALVADGHALPWEIAAYILRAVLAALDYAHRKKAPDGDALAVVHRDVSPHNVLVSYAGEVKLTDFGIARASTRKHQTTQQVVKGKLAYMAPEQARGLALDGRADLFAAGVSAYEWLANERPFRGNNESELVQRLLRGERAPIRSRREDIPEALAAVIEGLLEPTLSARIQSAAEALSLLDPLVTTSSARALSTIVSRYFADQSPSSPRLSDVAVKLVPSPRPRSAAPPASISVPPARLSSRPAGAPSHAPQAPTQLSAPQLSLDAPSADIALDRTLEVSPVAGKELTPTDRAAGDGTVVSHVIETHPLQTQTAAVPARTVAQPLAGVSPQDATRTMVAAGRDHDLDSKIADQSVSVRTTQPSLWVVILVLSVVIVATVLLTLAFARR